MRVDIGHCVFIVVCMSDCGARAQTTQMERAVPSNLQGLHQITCQMLLTLKRGIHNARYLSLQWWRIPSEVLILAIDGARTDVISPIIDSNPQDAFCSCSVD